MKRLVWTLLGVIGLVAATFATAQPAHAVTGPDLCIIIVDLDEIDRTNCDHTPTSTEPDLCVIVVDIDEIDRTNCDHTPTSTEPDVCVIIVDIDKIDRTTCTRSL